MNAPHSQPTRGRRGEDRRREIVQAAREVFSARGYGDASMAAIAEKVGVVEGALYKHFGSKRELLLEAARAHLAPNVAATREELAGISGVRNRVRFVVWRHLKEFVDDPGMCRLIIQEIRPYDDYRGSALHEVIRESTRLLERVLVEAEHAGELRPGVPTAVVRDLVYGGIEHLAFRVLSGRGTVDADLIADQITDLVLGGVEGASKPGSDGRLEAQIRRLERVVEELSATAKQKGSRHGT